MHANPNKYGSRQISVSLTAICPPCGKRRLHDFDRNGILRCSQGHEALEYVSLAYDVETVVKQYVAVREGEPTRSNSPA